MLVKKALFATYSEQIEEEEEREYIYQEMRRALEDTGTADRLAWETLLAYFNIKPETLGENRKVSKDVF
jgi:hypothetical protein